MASTLGAWAWGLRQFATGTPFSSQGASAGAPEPAASTENLHSHVNAGGDRRTVSLPGCGDESPALYPDADAKSFA